jgi:signal transduction histidine kinase
MATTGAVHSDVEAGAGRRRERLFLPWMVLTAASVAWMWLAVGGEVLPFHLIWIVFALAYGFEPWPVRRTAIALSIAGAASGAVLALRASDGVIHSVETLEIPLMIVLAALVVWHVQRREAAARTVRAFALRRSSDAAQRERLSKLTAHEMRTPLTIATSYVGVMLGEELDPARRSDLQVVADELARLGRAGDRVLRMIRLADQLATPIQMSPPRRKATSRTVSSSVV